MVTQEERTRLRVQDILEAIGDARDAVRTVSAETFSVHRLNRLAAERAIEIISEASRHIPPQMKIDEPEVPWQDIAGIGSVLRHDYPKVSPEIVWRVIHVHLGPLELALIRMLARLPPQEADP